MVAAILTGVSGWVLVVLVGATTWLPYGMRGGVLVALRANGRPPAFLDRLRPHYWLGYCIAALVLVHAWVPMSAGLATRVDSTGLYLATAALSLIVLQISLGLRLRDPLRRDRPRLGRLHFFTMLAIALTAAGHIALNGSAPAVLRTFAP